MKPTTHESPAGCACLTQPVRPYDGQRVCQHCGYYAKVSRRTVNQGWHVAEWGECRKADLARTGVMTPENETCADFTPDPRRWPTPTKSNPDAACSASYIDMTLTAKGLRSDVSKYLRRVADVIEEGWCHATFGWKEVGQKCHLTYDAKLHATNARITRDLRSGQMPLILG